jgi:nucleotide-binding universal stress UspA family protein
MEDTTMGAEIASTALMTTRGVPAIVVGADGSPASRAAVDFAVTEARRRQLSVELLHAFDLPIYATDPMGTAYMAIDREELVAAAEAVLQSEVARIARLAPDVAVRTVAHEGSAGPMLVDASKGAAMVVVGAKQRGELVDLVLGSVGHKVLHHAHCPVVLVPPAQPGAGRAPTQRHERT